MLMSCCHNSFWCIYKPINVEKKEQDYGDNRKLRKRFNSKKLVIFKVRK